jgi:hypothetical protein
MKQIERPLKIGEVVAFTEYNSGADGIIVERLDADYVRVKWADFSTPTIHRCHGLSRR